MPKTCRSCGAEWVGLRDVNCDTLCLECGTRHIVLRWEMFGRQADNGCWTTVGPELYVQMFGGGVVPVVVTEDADGDYLGWLKSGSEVPTLILHKMVFEIQFPYGSAAEVERGRGEVLALSVSIRDEES